MGFLEKVIGRKDAQKANKQKELEAMYSEVKRKIEFCEEEKERCIQEAAKCPPGSYQFNEFERAYNRAENNLTLLIREQQLISGALDAATSNANLEEYDKAIASIQNLTQKILPDAAKSEKRNARIAVMQEAAQSKVDAVAEINRDFFQTQKTETVRQDSAFSRAVAAKQHHDDQRRMDGMETSEPEPVSQEPVSAFAAKIAERQQSSDEEKKE